ncbi:MAG: VOC family protein [Solobacterium sp.]|nr:VOC family protein [Solobacterium sp.]
MIKSSVVFLPVSDIQKTYAFYHDLLGLEVAQKQGDNLYIFDTGYGYWGFCAYGDGRKILSGPQGVCLSLNVENKEEVQKMWESLEGKCLGYKEPQQHPIFPVYSCFVLDPDGYLVEFQKITDETQPLK